MTPIFEILLPRKPVSAQGTTKQSRKNKRDWQEYIYGRAREVWSQVPISEGELRFTVVYLSKGDPGDINNFIKPIQDALNSLVYADDKLIRDVSGHMRLLSEPIDIVSLPELLQSAVIADIECIYIRITRSSELNIEIKL